MACIDSYVQITKVHQGPAGCKDPLTQAADSMRYSAPYMYDAPNAFAAQPTHLRGIAPTVLKLQLTPLGLPLPHIAGPPSLGEPALPRIFNTFNPSIAPAQRLDYVLIPDRARLLEQAQPDGGEWWWALSDHIPVLVAFEA